MIARTMIWRGCVGGLLCAAWMQAAEGDFWAEDTASSREAAWIEVGVGWLPDVDGSLKWETASGAYYDEVRMKWGPGLAVHGGFREEFTSWLAAELEGGILWFEADSVTGTGGEEWMGDVTLLETPVLLNLVFQVPLKGRFTPFAGAGAGAVFSWLDLDERLPGEGGTSVRVEESSVETELAYQVFAGLRFRISAEGDISLTYRYLHGGDPTWRLRDTEADDTVGKLEAEDMAAHSVALGFHLRF